MICAAASNTATVLFYSGVAGLPIYPTTNWISIATGLSNQVVAITASSCFLVRARPNLNWRVEDTETLAIGDTNVVATSIQPLNGATPTISDYAGGQLYDYASTTNWSWGDSSYGGTETDALEYKNKTYVEPDSGKIKVMSIFDWNFQYHKP